MTVGAALRYKAVARAAATHCLTMLCD